VTLSVGRAQKRCRLRRGQESRILRSLKWFDPSSRQLDSNPVLINRPSLTRSAIATVFLGCWPPHGTPYREVTKGGGGAV
jgi:hypothetical protein